MLLRLLLLCILAVTSAASGAGLRASAARGGWESADVALPLPFFYDLYTFRGTDNTTDVVAAFAVPVGRLVREEAARRVRYRFDVTLVLADTARRTISRTDDSVFVDLPRPLVADHLLYTFIQVQAAPSGTTVQRVIMTDATTPGIGQLYDSPFPIPDYSGSQLMLSDIALGRPDTKSGWKRGDVTLALLPTSQFPASEFDVYYEIYNLPPGHRYLTEIAVEPSEYDAPPGDRRPVRIRFSGRSAARPDGALAELRRVDTSLARGRYRITVTITDEVTGHTASRSRSFVVRGWERGATLVAAQRRGEGLPR